MARTSLEIFNPVFKITKHENTFTNYTRGYWEDPELIERLDDSTVQKNK